MDSHRRNGKKKRIKFIFPVLILLLCLYGIYHTVFITNETNTVDVKYKTTVTDDAGLGSLTYDGEVAIEINDNRPSFSEDEIDYAKKNIYENYSPLDELGRCGVAKATIGRETQPPKGEKRTSLSEVTPSGWQKINFWSRCHLIGYQLSGENANEKNLITGTSWMNVSGMLPYENVVDDYLEINPDNHVLYEVSPVFNKDNLVANGVHMQALSIEDEGVGVCFNVYVFNYQPGYIINYTNGTIEDDMNHQTTITVYDKKADWTGDPIEIEPASVDGSTGSIRYIYYTDAQCHQRTTTEDGASHDGGAPSNVGLYYAKAVVAGDNWYPTAASNTATLVIQ